jgi:large subunit ribosomal protein L30e
MMMTKLLEKALTDAIKEKKRIIGVKQITASIKNCKLIVISRSVSTNQAKKVEENAQNENIPIIHFEGSSVSLGKLCGLQFRVSAISFNSLSTTNAQAILNESEPK